MSMHTESGFETAPHGEIASRFVAARRANEPLRNFPGEIPRDLASSYACQDAAINLWADEIAGWKIGRITDNLAQTLGANRLAGPIFRRSVMRARGNEAVSFPVYKDGFAAVEAEFILVVAEDAPAGKLKWTRDEARTLVQDVLIGVELAGSPLAAINDLGPTVVISDFGNNAGLIVGQSYEGWRARPEGEWRCETWIDGVLVGAGAADALPGGPFEALRFLLELNASRGRPLRAGDLVSSGAVTGVHDIRAGQQSRIVFTNAGVIVCCAQPRTDTSTHGKSAAAQ